MLRIREEFVSVLHKLTRAIATCPKALSTYCEIQSCSSFSGRFGSYLFALNKTRRSGWNKVFKIPRHFPYLLVFYIKRQKSKHFCGSQFVFQPLFSEIFTGGPDVASEFFLFRDQWFSKARKHANVLFFRTSLQKQLLICFVEQLYWKYWKNSGNVDGIVKLEAYLGPCETSMMELFWRELREFFAKLL